MEKLDGDTAQATEVVPPGESALERRRSRRIIRRGPLPAPTGGGAVIPFSARRDDHPISEDLGLGDLGQDPVGDPVDELPRDGAVPVSLGEVQPGDLVRVDLDGADTWVVVDEIEPDIEDPDAWCVGYRTDDGDDDQLILPEDCLLERRPPRG